MQKYISAADSSKLSKPKFAIGDIEVYMPGYEAEALLMDGQGNEAVKYINIVRERAAFPTGDPDAMKVDAADLSVDFILDERTRELCGQNMRWWDYNSTKTFASSDSSGADRWCYHGTSVSAKPGLGVIWFFLFGLKGREKFRLFC